MTAQTVLIFAKPPLMGLSKTRLAQSLNRSQAQRIARYTMRRTLQACMNKRWSVCLYTTPRRVLPWSLGGLWPTHLTRADQGGGDLTARLDRGLASAAAGKVLFVGADAPDITPALLTRAFKVLNTHDAVFGPADDGGFWLFGLRSSQRSNSPFGNVRWSTEHALADVRSNLPEESAVAYLPTLIDIDTVDDWTAWNERKRLSRKKS